MKIFENTAEKVENWKHNPALSAGVTSYVHA